MDSRLVQIFIRIFAVSPLAFPFALSTTKALASLEPGLPAETAQVSCASQIRALLGKWGSAHHWRQKMSASSRESLFATPTDQVGVWLEISVADQEAVVSRVTAGAVLSAHFDSADCAPTLAPALIEGRPSGKVFGDPELSRVLEGSKTEKSTGIVYIWSHFMPLSVRGKEEAKRWAAQRGYQFISIGDRRDDHATDPINDSRELIERGMGNHFPSMVFFKDGQIVEGVIPGYKSALALDELSKSHLPRE